MPTIDRDPAEIEEQDRARRIRNLLASGDDLSDTAIAQRVFGYANGRTIEKVQQIRQQQNT